MSDRKYGQRGYMESDREPQRKKPQSTPRDREGPRSPRMMAFGETVKRAACGAKAPPSINFESPCTNSRAELHTCRQCTNFDPGARSDCSKPTPARVGNTNPRHTRERF